MPVIFKTISIPVYLFNDEQLRDLAEKAVEMTGEVVSPELPQVIDALILELRNRGQDWFMRDGKFQRGQLI